MLLTKGTIKVQSVVTFLHIMHILCLQPTQYDPSPKKYDPLHDQDSESRDVICVIWKE